MKGGRGVRRAAAVLLAAGIASLAGCAAAPSGQTEADLDFADMIGSMIQEAEAGGASDGQLAILREAQAAGVVSFEEAREAALAAIDCVENAGSEAVYDERTTDEGLVLPQYSWLSGTPQQEAIGDACDTQEAFWVNGAYQMQPTSLALRDAYLDRQMPIVRACLEDAGYVVDANATTHEVLRQAADAITDTGGSVDCLTDANIDGF